LKYSRASDVRGGEAWNLGIMHNADNVDNTSMKKLTKSQILIIWTAEFLRVLDNIPSIKTDASGNQRVWRKFPTIMKNNYNNFTSHPTDPKDPRVASWRNTLQWLENQYLSKTENDNSCAKKKFALTSGGT
jgi:hypothetical protein